MPLGFPRGVFIAEYDQSRYNTEHMQPKITQHQQFIDQDYSKTGIIREHIEDCRFAAVVLYETAVENTHYVDCKFSSINWRHSSFKKVVFKNCIFDKVDFSGSEFISCQFIDCIWQDVSIEQCKVGVKKLDVSGTKFGAVIGIAMLAGHTLTYQQAIELLPALLHEKDITIEEDTNED